jgi:DNA-binding response OmpR family regulator
MLRRMSDTLRPRAGLPPRILVVDDLADARALYAIFLTLEGFFVVQAASVEEALEVIAAEPPDLVVTDLAMPGQSGVALCRTIRRHAPHVPIIAITALALTKEERRELEDAMCDVLLTKPCPPAQLHAEIRRLLGSGR